MDKMSIIAILLVSIPEEYLFILQTGLIVGNKNFLSIKDTNTQLRIVVTTFLTVLSVVFLRTFSEYFLLNVALLQLICFIVTYTFILKIKWYKSTIGILITLTSYALYEIICVALVMKIFNISIEDIYSNDTYRVTVSILPRLLQIITVNVLYNLRKPLIDIGIIGKFTKSISKKVTYLHVNTILALIVTCTTIKYFIFDSDITKNGFNELIFIVFNIIILVILLVTLVVRLSLTIKQEKEETEFTLLWVISLCNTHKGNTEKIKEIIENYIRNGGKLK